MGNTIALAFTTKNTKKHEDHLKNFLSLHFASFANFVVNSK